MTINVDGAIHLDFAYIDVGPLRDRDGHVPGFYVAASRMGDTEEFKGGVVYGGFDGSNWDVLGVVVKEAKMGLTESTLGTTVGSGTFDTTSTVKVRLWHGTLESKTADEVLAGANLMLIGGELVGFQTATLESGGEYTLSNLMRSRRGTSDASHASNERCILLDPQALIFVPMNIRDIGDTVHLKVVPSGGAIVDYPSYSFTFSALGYWGHSRLFNKIHLKSRTETAPPASPSEGDTYFVATTASGDWSGHEDELAIWTDRWVFLPIPDGMVSWVEDDDSVDVWDGSAWSSLSGQQPAFTSNTQVVAGADSQGAFPVTQNFIHVATVGSADDSITLPVPTSSSFMMVVNASANAMNIYPASGGYINEEAQNDPVSLPAGKTAVLFKDIASATWRLTQIN